MTPRRRSPGSATSSAARCELSARCGSENPRYARELDDSLDWRQQPCADPYGFVCGRWHSGSARSRAEHDAQTQALSTAFSARESGHVGALVRACLRHSPDANGDLELMSRFLEDRGLPLATGPDAASYGSARRHVGKLEPASVVPSGRHYR
ncbi:hypothetical protein MRX96_029788 [Rhipicephalus microplus]